MYIMLYCQAIGCDGMSSGATVDGCGICKGDNSTCTVVEGVLYDEVGERKSDVTYLGG